RIENHLGDLPPVGRPLRLERPIPVAGDYVVVVGRFDVVVEGTTHGHVGEVRRAGHVYLPLLGKHDYLAQLAPRYRVAWTERAIAVPRDHPMAVCRLHIWVKPVPRVYVNEVLLLREHEGPALGQHHYL